MTISARQRGTVLAAIILVLGCSANPAAAARLEQIISRENPAFNPALARLVIGRDGKVYLSSGGDSSYVLRMSRDGQEKVGGTIIYATANVTANADGVIASANGHFAHQINLYKTGFTHIGNVSDFLVNDQVGWDAPAHVECGASGDFYGIDQHRDRIVRITPAGKQIMAYNIPHKPDKNGGLIQDFRVCEKTKAFYLLTRSGPLRCVGFDGKERWTFNTGVTWGDTGNGGGFDVDDNGVLFTIERHGTAIKKISAAGKLLGTIPLRMGTAKPGPAEHGFMDLRVFGSEVLLKRKSDTELFQRYDLANGAQKGVVQSAHERLTVTFPAELWTAGKPLPFRIALSAGKRTLNPRWRVWARPLGSLDYRAFALNKSTLQVPGDCAGIYQIKVTPEVQPWQRGAGSEYLVRTWVEIRPAGTQGSVSVFTPDNRLFYGRGEPIPFHVLVRKAALDQAVQLSVRLAQGKRTLAQGTVTSKDLRKAIPFYLPRRLTAGLAPGRYTLRAEAPGLACGTQSLVIGHGGKGSPFHFVQYGDYTPIYPSASVHDAPDRTAAHVERTARLGVNLVVDRLGTQTGALVWSHQEIASIEQLRKRLQVDAKSPAPDKGLMASPLLQTQAAYGAHGIEQMAILMANDAGLPLGTGFDSRKPAELTATLTKVTQALKPYPSFRGWSWSSNWWVFNNRGSAAARTPAEKADYEKALKVAKETGAWNPVLDRVSGYRLSYAVEAQELFNRTLKGIAPGLVTAVACPHRNVDSYPPVTLSNVDEVDLQAQWEQVALPYHAPHGVDFYKRPGKPAWTHPEIWNDAGTGEQILPTLLQALMRGAGGVGFSGPVPPWGARPEDDRLSYQGTVSVYRALGGLLRQYGPWLRTLQNNDRVAIVVSGRMLRIDDWGNVMGRHFARLFEAYVSCLHAHQPARFVFVEDLKPDTLEQFKAVLVVGQTVEMEKPLTTALQNARNAGVAVFHDGTCRASLVKGFTPLGVSFNQFEKDPSPAADDAAYPRFLAYCRSHLPALRKTLGASVKATAEVDNEEVFLSERKSEAGRYLFVINNTTPDLEPGQLWRMSLYVACRVPVLARVKLGSDSGFVYDVFAGKQVQPKDGIVPADCRSLPGRIFAVLPAEIARVELNGPEEVKAGQSVTWAAAVKDGQGSAIRASIPLRIRLIGAGGVVQETWTASDSRGTSGTFTVPLTAVGGQELEATELLSGRTARLRFTVSAGEKPTLRTGTPSDNDSADKPLAPKAKTTGSKTGDWQPADHFFGPHVRDLVVTANGSLAVMNTMNHDHNLQAVDVKTGQVKWRQRLGHYFAFAPQEAGEGYAVQGFDFNSAEGYHLYLGGADGKPDRRFALYGLPKRLPHRFVPGILNDRINNFAVPPDGSWVASAGDLGLSVWKRNGQLLWSQDWWRTHRHTATLATLDAQTLLVLEGMKATAYAATTGKRLWEQTLAATGEVRAVQCTPEGRTCAVLATTDGGKIYILNKGKVAATLPALGGDAFALAPEGTHVAVVTGNQLKLYSVADGLQWLLSGDDALHFPRFAADGKRIVVSSELGSVYVLDEKGTVLLERDLGALAVPAWLKDGDLLLATWMGTVCRLDGDYKERWRTQLQPAAQDMRGKLLTAEKLPTTRIASWGNAEAKPAALTPNLLDPKNVVIKFKWEGSPQFQLVRDPSPLVDGKATPPPAPWLTWEAIGWMAESNPVTYLLMDTYRTQMRVTGITLVEDPDHPESWLRDAGLEYWDAAREKWIFVQPLLSNAAVHTHKLTKPIEAARLRIVLPLRLVGNLRLEQIVLHGQKRGPSHPAVIARRPVAVLFDEGDDLKEHLNGLTFRFEGAYAGGRCIATKANANLYPPFQPPFGHVIPNWDFEIAEKPGPGQYRYLQFAWRALDRTTKGISLRLDGEAYGKSVALYAGRYTADAGTIGKKMGEAPPLGWQVVRVDLWDVFKKPVRIRSMRLASPGGPAAFDQILLGRSAKDFPAVKK